MSRTHRLALQQQGDRCSPTVVFGNSLGTTASVWDDSIEIERLADDHHVVRYELPGHGGAPVRPGTHDLVRLAEDLLADLDDAGIDAAHHVGTSLGGMIAMQVALLVPERVLSLTLTSTSARPGPPSLWHDRAASARASGLTDIATAAVRRWLPPATRQRSPEFVRRLEDDFSAVAPEGFAACCDALAGVDLHADLHRIAHPTLVIVGTEDTSTPRSDARELADHLPAAHLEIIEGAGHLLIAETPGRFAALLRTHLRAQVSPG